MDFITLAQRTSVKAISRHLLSEDDDFEHLDTTQTSNHGESSQYMNDSILGVTQRSSEFNSFTDQELENAPILSKVSEAELFFLATNFLLYVAMVLIITMVCKIYFPEALERLTSDSIPETRTYNYRRVETNEKERSLNYYSSDEEDDSNEEKEEQGLLSQSESNIDERNKESSRNVRKTNKNLLEFDQSSASKKDVVSRLIFCIIMLNVTFVAWGVLQERMLTRRYPRFTGEFFTYSYLLVFTTRLWTLIMSGILMWYLKPRRSSSTVIYEYSFPSISNMLSR
jgi:hypothetical protein